MLSSFLKWLWSRVEKGANFRQHFRKREEGTEPVSLKGERHASSSGVLLQYCLQNHSLSPATSCKAQSFGPELQMSLGTMGAGNKHRRGPERWGSLGWDGEVWYEAWGCLDVGRRESSQGPWVPHAAWGQARRGLTGHDRGQAQAWLWQSRSCSSGRDWTARGSA